ncbi:phage holin [Virgibacillus ndiopensis]|uniref:phage holin n=1 Tax=Virgibacillus ndiopensis TaxID=2004408 RepID=UPI000C06B0F8|nr:phage holin [Virgibacillus ndiopensis]
MEELDKGTIVRTAALLLALVNQMLVIYGKSPLPIDSELIEQFVASLFTIISAVVAWFKNNYVTKTGEKQRELLQKNGLTKVKGGKSK